VNYSSPVIAIVPRLPPAIDGVGDYAHCLAQQMRQDFGIQAHFIVCDPSWSGPSDLDGFPVSRLDRRSATDLYSMLKQQSSVSILLHYVGYGYAKRGCPIWLANALDQWKARNSNARLVTMFHEAYASGPIWTSAFWLSSLQKHLATRLASLSDRCVTSTEIVTAILTSMVNPTTQADIITLPVFSTVGEPDHLKPLAERPRRLVVFGSRGVRKRVYEQAYAHLAATAKALEIDTIYDIGAPTGLDITQVEHIPVVSLGKCSAVEVSQHLQEALAGFLDYPPRLLGKSTIFAAYAAHGLLPIVNAPVESIQIDGLESGKHYWITTASADLLNPLAAAAIASNAYGWYKTHNLASQSRIIAPYLFNHA
jgi:hypothetical protein